MDSQTSSLLNQLGTLSEASHFFLNEQNRNGLYEGWSYETTATYLQQIAFNLNLVDLLSEEEAGFEKLLSALDQFLSSTNENQLDSVVPTDILENLKTILDEENLKNEELLERIRTENKERLAYLKKLRESRKRLELKIEKPLVSVEELQEAVPTIIDKIQPEIGLLVEEAQKARENEELRTKIQEKGQEIYLKAIRENNEISLEVKEFLLSRQISAETVIKLAEAPITEQNTRQKEILLNSISPPSPEEIKILEEEIIPQIAVNISNLSETTLEEAEEAIAVSLAQKLDEIKDFSPDKIGNLVNEILPEVQNIIAEKDKTPVFLEIPKTITNLSPEETTFLKETVLPAVAAKIPNLSSQTTPEEIKGVIWTTFRQEIGRTAPLRNISNERIQSFVNEILPEVQNIIAEKNKTLTLFKRTPTINEGKNQVYISLTSTRIPDNPPGEVYRLTDINNRTLGQDFLKSLKDGTLKENFNRLKERASEWVSLKLTIQGFSSEELMIRASQNRLKGTTGSSQKATQLSTIAENLRLFKEKYFFRSSLPQQWIANKIKSSQIFQQVSSFAKSGFAKGITSAIGKAGLQTAQKGLQTLWNTIKTGAGKVVAGGITKILTGMGLQAIATFTLPIIGNVIAFLAPKILKGIKNGIGKIGNILLFPIGIANAILGKITGNEGEDQNSNWLKRLIIVIFIIIFVLPLLGAGVTGGAFVGQYGSSESNPEAPKDFLVTKTVTPSHIENNGNRTFHYKVTVTAKEFKLTGVKFTEAFTQIKKDGTKTNLDPPPVVTGFPAAGFSTDIEPAQQYGFDYDVTYNNNIQDSAVINTVVAEGELQKTEPITISYPATAGISIGDAVSPELQCEPSRHLAEEVICKVAHEGAPPCDNEIIDSSSRNEVGECFDKITISMGDKKTLRDGFMGYNCAQPEYNCALTCLQFINIIEAALGHPFDIGNGSAKDYADHYNTDAYDKVLNPVLGDIAVWKPLEDQYGGHVAVYLGQIPGSETLIVAEANTTTHGIIIVRDRPNQSYGGGPAVYLHYKK